MAPEQESMAAHAGGRSCMLLQNAACLAERNLPLKVVQFTGDSLETSQNQWCHWQKDRGCALPLVPSGSDLTLYLLMLRSKHFQVWLAQVSSRFTCLLCVLHIPFILRHLHFYQNERSHDTRGRRLCVSAGLIHAHRFQTRPCCTVLGWTTRDKKGDWFKTGTLCFQLLCSF